MKKYILNVREINTKSAKFHYTVTDETGAIISERKSHRVYVACTIDGQYYFGRLDLIGKGDHGKQLKYQAGWGWVWKQGREQLVPGQHTNIQEPKPIAYLQSAEHGNNG